MDVPTWVWLATVAGLGVLFALDLLLVDRKPHAVGMAEATRWVGFYLACAVAFGLGVWLFAGSGFAVEFAAGYLTEYSLSVDNLFIFLIIMTAFRVPTIQQHRVLLIGIMLALAMRGMFIAAGAALIANFSWVFYLFGALLIFLGWRQIRQRNHDVTFQENAVLRALRKLIPVTDDYEGSRLTVVRDGKRWFTPMIVVMIAIGSVDLVFALDSIPAIFGLTKEPYIVFTANAFALLGLRQLYFLLGALMDRLVHLSYGLSVILGFIGVKMVFEALHSSGVEHVGPVAIPTIGIAASLSVIIGVLAVTTVTSLWSTRGGETTSGEVASAAPADPALKAD